MVGAVRDIRPKGPTMLQTEDTPTRLEWTPEQRRDELDRRLQVYAAGGYRVEQRTDFTASIAKGKDHNHILHLLLTIFTLGLWGLFVWLPLCMFGGLKRRMLTVDSAGIVLDQKL